MICLLYLSTFLMNCQQTRLRYIIGAYQCLICNHGQTISLYGRVLIKHWTCASWIIIVFTIMIFLSACETCNNFSSLLSLKTISNNDINQHYHVKLCLLNSFKEQNSFLIFCADLEMFCKVRCTCWMVLELIIGLHNFWAYLLIFKGSIVSLGS